MTEANPAADPSATLAGIRERISSASTYDDWHRVARDARAAVASVEAVLKLHVPIPDGPDWCRECGHSFPCWTLRAITAALTGKEAGDG